MVGGGGGETGVMFFSHFMLFTKILGGNTNFIFLKKKPINSHLMFSSCFF